MARDRSFWLRMLGGRTDKNSPDKQNDNQDLMEEGLRGLSGTGAPQKRHLLGKRVQSLGEEIGNSVTHGAMALFMIGMLPYAAIRAYTRAPEGMAVIDAFGVSLFIICVFFMFLASTVYHTMRPGTTQKQVMHRLDHIMIYFAIAGTYTPIALSVIGGTLGLALCIAQWSFVLAGTLIKSLAFSRSTKAWILTVVIYLLMGWMIILCIPVLFTEATAVAFWLILSGGICYTAGVICFVMRFPYAHMVWHFFVDFGAICHFIALVFWLR